MLSISSNKYEPPCKSKPRLIFLFKKLFSNLNKFDEAIKIKKNEIKDINNIFNFEKYNTLIIKNYFLTSCVFIKLCMPVPLTTSTVTLSAISTSTLSLSIIL